jgi:hemerythrin
MGVITMSLVWSEQLSVGVETIDKQHARFIDEFNALLAAFRANEGNKKVFDLVDFLERYAGEHFAEEERYMRMLGYPAMDGHLEQHRTMTEDLAKLKETLHRDGASMSNLIKLSEFSLNWFIKHIKNADAQLGSFLKVNM